MTHNIRLIDSSCLRHTWSHTSLTLGAISLDGLDE